MVVEKLADTACDASKRVSPEQRIQVSEGISSVY